MAQVRDLLRWASEEKRSWRAGSSWPRAQCQPSAKIGAMAADGPYRGRDAQRRWLLEELAALRARLAPSRGLSGALGAELRDREGALRRRLCDEDASLDGVDAELDAYRVAVDTALTLAEVDVARGGPRQRYRRRVLAGGLLVVVVAGLALLWQSHRRATEECRRSADCAEWGRCTARIVGLGEACIASAPADCAHACMVWGRCQWAGDRCGALTDAQCGASERCRTHGECEVLFASHDNWDGATTGSCTVPDDDACARSARCASHRLCVLHRRHCDSMRSP